MTLFCEGRVILLAVPTSLHINILERQPGLLGTSIGEKTRAYASAVGLGKGVSFSCMKWNRSLKLSTRNFRIDLPRIWLEWAHTMTLGRVLGGQFNIIIMLYRRTQLVHLTLLDFWALRCLSTGSLPSFPFPFLAIFSPNREPVHRLGIRDVKTTRSRAG